MIKNACNTLLSANPGTLPDMQDALTDYFQRLSFVRVKKETINFQNVETETPHNFMGVRQPFSPQQLMLKPVGQRSWLWEMIHSYPDLILTTDEVILFGKVRYRVMQKLDYKEYGYIEYHIVQDYTK